MSRMAAKFTKESTPNLSSMPSGSGAVKQKKFCTRGEEFLDFLKALGYEPASKHQKYEHFEYLFQNDKSANFVKKLMATMKTQHCLLPEEVESFEILKKDGFALYGNDLETAVSRRRAINEMYNQQKLKNVRKKEDLEKELERKKVEVEKLKELEAAFQVEVAGWQTKETKVKTVLSIVQRLVEDSEKDIEVDLKLLNEKMVELERNVVEHKKDLSVENPTKSSVHYLCQIDGRNLLEKEEKLFEMTHEMIRKHGAKLIIKEAGYGVEGDPLNSENVRRVFFQFEKDFERLKHCIIFERVRKIEMEMAIAGQRGSADTFDECLRKAKQLSEFDYDISTKLQLKNREDIDNLTIAFQRESEELLNHVRQSTLSVINQQFSALTNIKARSKKKLHEFFTLVSNVLKAQKVRLSLIRSFVKTEGKLYGRLLSNIEDNLAASSMHSEKLMSKQSKSISGLTLEGQIFSYLLEQFGIPAPVDILQSIPEVHTIVEKIFSEMEESTYSVFKEDNAQCQNDFKHLCKKHELLKKLLESTTHPSKEVVRNYIRQAEEHSKVSEEKLNALKQSRVSQVKERVIQPKANLENMKDLLNLNRK